MVNLSVVGSWKGMAAVLRKFVNFVMRERPQEVEESRRAQVAVASQMPLHTSNNGRLS
jgi:hypothetical protein